MVSHSIIKNCEDGGIIIELGECGELLSYLIDLCDELVEFEITTNESDEWL